MKTCGKCKVVKEFSEFHRHKNKGGGYQALCKPCRKVHDNQRYDDCPEKLLALQLRQFADPKIRSAMIWNAARRRAKEKGEIFSISRARISFALLLGKCERTGISFSMERPKITKNNPFSPSIDKIDATKFYTDCNIQVVCWCYNAGKQQMTNDQYEAFILEAAKHIEDRRRKTIEQMRWVS